MRFRFSANTGYLWKELPFLDRIRQAADHGFEAVEFHDEAQTADRCALKDVLAETGLPVVGLNARMGETFGCAAIADMRDQSLQDISEAIELAEDLNAGAIHVLSGKASGAKAHEAYLDALSFALDNTKRTILIEPVCTEQVPEFFLKTIDQAAQIVSEIANNRLKIIFDCYHVHRESGSVLENFKKHVNKIGHVQISAAEGRAEPLPGELDYSVLLPAMQQSGYSGLFGCEYRPIGSTQDGLGWRDRL